MQELIFIWAPLLALHNCGLNQTFVYQLCSQQEFAPFVMCEKKKLVRGVDIVVYLLVQL